MSTNGEVKTLQALNKMEDIALDALNVLHQDVRGEAVNQDRLKSAKCALAEWYKLRKQIKEEENLELLKKKFNYRILSDFGSEEDRAEVRRLVKESTDVKKIVE